MPDETSTGRAPRRGGDAPALLALGLLQLLAFHRPLFSETFFFRDLYLLFFFARTRVAEQLAQGRLPLWDPLLNGGRPLLADVNFTALYPGNLLYLVFDPLTSFNLEIVGHFALAGLGAYLAARRLGLSPRAALPAAVVFELCGFALSLANLVNRLLALPWLPLLFVAWHRTLTGRRRRDLVATSVVAALQVLAGFPELTLLSFVTLLALSFAVPSPLGTGRRIASLAAAGLLAAGLAAGQLVPGLALVSRSVRGSGLGAESVAAWSVHPARLPELVVPGFFGRTDTIPDSDYWGAAREHQGFPYILSLYFGLPALLLALLGATEREEESFPAEGRMRVALSLLAVSGMVLALGRHLPLFSLALEAPGVTFFRYPVKLLALSLLPVALLAGAGAERLLRGRLTNRALALLALPPSLAAAAAIGWRTSDSFRRTAESLFFGAPSDAAGAALPPALLHAALAGFGLVAAALLARTKPRLAVPVLPALLAADLLSAGAPVNPMAPRALFSPPPLAAEVRARLAGGKLYRARDPLTLSAPGPELFWLARRNLEKLQEYTAAGYGIPLVHNVDFDGLIGRRIAALGRAVDASAWPERSKLLAASGATLVLTAERPRVPGMTPLVEAPLDPAGTLTLYRNEGAPPSVALLSRWTPVASPREALRAVLREDFDARREVALEGGPAGGGSGAAGSVLSLSQRDPAEMLVRVRAAGAAVLFVATPHERGWLATVDGAPRPILTANGAFQAVFVEAGDHEVRLRYRPPGLTAGLVLTGLSVAVALAWLALGKSTFPLR